MLENELKIAGIEWAVFKYNSIELKNIEEPHPRGPMLALVDPFSLYEDEWRDLWLTVSSASGSIMGAGMDGLILVFHYSKDGAPKWQKRPAGFSESICVIDHSPFYLAAYGTNGIFSEASELLKRLGWQSQHSTTIQTTNI